MAYKGFNKHWQDYSSKLTKPKRNKENAEYGLGLGLGLGFRF